MMCKALVRDKRWAQALKGENVHFNMHEVNVNSRKQLKHYFAYPDNSAIQETITVIDPFFNIPFTFSDIL